MAVLSRAFIDESGGIDLPHFVMGGYVGTVEMWNAFADDWQRVLDSRPGWPPFHAVTCESGRGGFEVLDEAGRKKRIGELIRVIAKHKPTAFVTHVDVADFKARVPPFQSGNRRKQAWRYPYVFTACHLFGALSTLGGRDAPRFGTIEVVFDYMDPPHRTVSGEIIEGGVLDALNEDPQLRGRLGTPRWPRPEERVNYVPLQAADLLVWNWRRRLSDQGWRHRRNFRELMKAARPFGASAKPGADLLGRWIAGHLSQERRATLEE